MTTISSRLHQQSEWNYHVEHSFQWDSIFSLYSTGINSWQQVSDVLNVSAEFCENNLWPRAKILDVEGAGSLQSKGQGQAKFLPSPTLKANMDDIAQRGFLQTSISEEYGGLGLPFSVALLQFQQVARACLSTSAQVAFTVSIADMLDRFASKEMNEKYIQSIAQGTISGAMCLTEPDAGSDLGALTTYATPTDSIGKYQLTGRKCFITNAAGGVALVLARIKGDPQGLKGLSLFLSEEAQVTKIEHKMGMNGSATCEVVFENASSHIIGKPGEGFSMMLHLMNEARLSVGLQGLAAIERAEILMSEYADERMQFGKKLNELPLYKKNQNDIQIESDGLRAFLVDTLSYYDVYQRIHLIQRQGRLITDQQRLLFERSRKIIRRRTPLAKYYGTECAARLVLKALQGFGGYGYMKEYQIERIYRDAIGGLLYEGTSQIQSLMAMKDLVKDVAARPTFLLKGMTLDRASGGLGAPQSMRQLRARWSSAVVSLLAKCLRLPVKGLPGFISGKAFQREDVLNGLMMHAEELCEVTSYLEVLDVLAKQGRQQLFHDYRRLVWPRMVATFEKWRIA